MDDNVDHEIKPVHLVGSLPFSSTEDAFRSVIAALNGRVKRMPDGETGERYYFTQWQLKNPVFARQPLLTHEFIKPSQQTTFTTEEIDAMVSNMHDFETGYDVAALQSYEVFRRLRAEGTIPEDVRFMVAFPTPVVLVGQYFRKALMARVEPVVESHMLEVVRRIQDAIPPKDLAIQWDAPIEFALLEERDAAIGGPGHVMEPWFEPLFDRVIERLVKLGEAIDPEVEVGYHFCYGDVNATHFLQPKDAGLMTDVGTAVLGKIRRPVQWIHLPVPKDRKDSEYFQPLRGLVEITNGQTEIYLGLVHEYDLEGTRERIKAAKAIVPSFGVATECGMGRRNVEMLLSTWEISQAVSVP